MSKRNIFLLFFVAALFLVAIAIPTKSNPGSETTLIAGRNVNMVSGTQLPLGDPWLQRQNEPSIAVSSRNPLHLFAAANDYRTIDMPHPYEVRGIPGVSAGRDAWIGVFESFDGGESWISMLLPGFPQDRSDEGLASPIYGLDTACDPKVCAGAEGVFYLSGIAFMRNQLAGVVFVSRYVDRNNRESVEEVVDENTGERKYVGPIEYVDTRIVGIGNPGQFIDMPNMAVDVPRGSAPFGNLYLAYTVFLGNTGINVRSRVVFVTSTDGGINWSNEIKLTESQHIIQRPVIAIDPSDPTGKTIYVVFRRFAHGQTPGGIAFVKSIDGGRSFTKPADVATLLCPFDQWTIGDGIITSPRTNSYPAMAVEVVNGKGVPYVVWAQRYDQDGNPDPDGQARIVFSFSENGGITWSEPLLVDPYYSGDGHQYMPSTTCAGSNKTVIWYDQRDDISLHQPNEKFMEDVWLDHRHTIDVRAAEAPVGSPIFGPSILLSRYLFFMQFDENGMPYMDGGEPILWQGQYNYNGLPLFYLGTKPFQGDYIQVISSPSILPPPAPGSNSWSFNTDPSEPTRSHGVWSDTRDVWPPGGDLWGNWINYNPPNSVQDPDFAQQNPCSNEDTTGMRNQNIYTADLNHGVIVGSPVNTKQLDIERSFVVFVKDTIGYTDTNGTEGRLFNLSLQEVGGVNASFDQFIDVDTLDITVFPHSSVSSTVYVDQSQNLFAPVIVNVEENGTLVGRVYLNPDSTNNPIPDLGDETHTPRMSNPRTWRYGVGDQDEPNSIFLSPRAQNPRAQNSGYVNPRAQNPRAQNPRAQNPRAQNPRAQNENIVNNSMHNPRAQNPRAQNAALTDMTWTVTNDGNTTSAYTFSIATEDWEDLNLAFDVPLEESLIAQVLVYKTHMSPIDSACELFLTHADELLVNIPNPRAQNPRAQNVAPTSSYTTSQNNGAEPITFYLGPGEQAEVIFRVYDPNTTQGYSFDDFIETVGGQSEAEAANTGEEEPEWVEQPDAPWGPDPSYLPEIGNSPDSLSFATVLGGTNPDDQILTIWNSGGGDLVYTISDDAGWLSVSPLDGISYEPGEGYDEQEHTVSVDITGLTAGTYEGTITITDPNANNNPLRVPVTLTISVASYLKVTGNGPDMAGDPRELTITAYDQYDYVATQYSGSKQLIFSGPGPAPDGTPPTVEGVNIGNSVIVNFTAGVSDPGAASLVAYNAETTSVDVTDGTIDSFADLTYDYDLTVVPAAFDTEGSSVSNVAPSPPPAGSMVTVEVTTYDEFQNLRTTGGDSVYISIEGANPNYFNPEDVSFSNGIYSISYTPTQIGTDSISANINDWDTTRDADGVSDGVYHLTVIPGAATNLVFSVQPGGATAGEVWTQQPIVEVRDLYGNTVISDNSTQLTLAIDNNPNVGTLSGTITATVSAGVATFTDLSIDNAGAGYTLEATSVPSYTSTTSDAFDVNAKITGRLLYNGDLIGEVIPNLTSEQLFFTVRKIDVWPPVIAHYDDATGEYTLLGIPPGAGQVSISLIIDTAEPYERKHFPGNFVGGQSFIMDDGQTVISDKDINCQQLIHLVSPFDISSVYGHSSTFKTHQSPILFQWNPIAEVDEYRLSVDKYQDDPNQKIETVIDTIITSNTQQTINLPPSGNNDHYQFDIRGYSATPGQGQIAYIMVVYTNGWGWDYRFKVIPGPVAVFEVDAPDIGVVDSPFSMTITARDSGGNPTTDITGTTVLSVDDGTITPNSIPENEFTDDGVWTGNITISGTSGLRTVTAVNNGNSGDTTITVNTSRVITGTLKYNGAPITNKTTTENVSIVLNIAPELNPEYDNSTGQYTFLDVDSGTYQIVAHVDAASPVDGRYFPGDYHNWSNIFTVSEGDSVITVDIELRLRMNLTSPFDNSTTYGIAPPSGPYHTHSSPITFQWEAIPEATSYRLCVQKSTGEMTVNWITTSNTWVSLSIPESGAGDYYRLSLIAENASSGQIIADTYTIYDNGFGTVYPFKALPGFKVTTTSLYDAFRDGGYVDILNANYGIEPYSWGIISGALPAGLALTPGTNRIEGTVSGSATTSTFTVQATDSGTPSQSVTRELTISVYDPPVITTTALPSGTTGTSYSTNLTGSGGNTPYTWSLYSGSLPPGLSLNASTGEISGIPATDGIYSFEIRLTDSSNPNQTATANLSIAINAGTRTISGTVETLGTVMPGVPIPDVTIYFSGGAGTATTISDGTYSHTVPYGWSGTTYAAKAGYTFSPSSRTYTNVTSNLSSQDYTGTWQGDGIYFITQPSDTPVNQTISPLVRVQVVDDTGDPLPGVTVTVTIYNNPGGATPFTVTSISNAIGIATFGIS